MRKAQTDSIIPGSALEAWFKDYAADPDNWGEDPDKSEVVVPFEKPAVPSQERSQPSWMMMAGLLVIAGGALLYSLQRQQDLDRAVVDLSATRVVQRNKIDELQTEADRMQDQLASLRESKRCADTALSQATKEIAQFETVTEDLKDTRNQRNGLERQIATLEGDRRRAQPRRQTRSNTSVVLFAGISSLSASFSPFVFAAASRSAMSRTPHCSFC